MRTPAIRRNLSLETLDFRTQDESLRLEDAIDRPADFVANRRVLRLQIQQWHRRLSRHNGISVTLLPAGTWDGPRRERDPEMQT